METRDTTIYLVVDSRLNPGQQAVQAAHAGTVFAGRYFGDYSKTTLVLLAAESDTALRDLMQMAQYYGTHCEGFWDPALTAVCFADTPPMRRLLRKLPLALTTPLP